MFFEEDRQSADYRTRCEFFGKPWTQIVPARDGSQRAVVFLSNEEGEEHYREHPDCQGLFAVSVPGTILCPWDSDFSRVYLTHEESEAIALARAVADHEAAAAQALRLLG